VKKSNVNYLEDINLSQLTLSEKSETKNLCRATSYLVVSQSSSSRTQIRGRKFNPAKKKKSWSDPVCGPAWPRGWV